MIKSLALLLLFLLLLAVSAAGQDPSPVRCVVTLYHPRGEEWKLIKSVEFLPTMGEEELTNKSVRLPGSGLLLFASVFPTDESMHSAKGADSLKLGLGVKEASSIHSRDIAGGAREVPYPQVKKIEGNNLSTGAQITIAVGIFVLVVTLIFGRLD